MPSAVRVANRYLWARARTRTMRLYHGTTQARAEAILRDGFDLNRIKSRWVNDWAVSVLTSPTAILKYFGNKPGMVVLEMTFRGTVAELSDVQHIGSMAASPQDYNRRVRAEGIDAVALAGSGARQVFVYNPATLSSIHIWQP